MAVLLPDLVTFDYLVESLTPWFEGAIDELGCCLFSNTFDSGNIIGMAPGNCFHVDPLGWAYPPLPFK